MLNKAQLQKVTLAAQEVGNIAKSVPKGFPTPDEAKEIQLFISKCEMAMDTAARMGAFRCTVTFDTDTDKRFEQEIKYALRDFNPTFKTDGDKKILSLCWE